MSSFKYKEILQNIKPLNTSAKRNIIRDTSKMIIEDKKSKKSISLFCPYCDGKNIVKNGKNKESQRYLCKSCKKSFVLSTNTPIYYSKKNILIWMKFIECLKKQYSIRKTAKYLNISPSTAFFWRHKIMDALREKEKAPILKNKILCERVLFGESFKGNHSKDGFKMPRESYSSENKTILREISRQRISVLTLLDSNNNCFIKPISIGKPSSIELIKNLGNKIEKSSKLKADRLYSYKILASFCNLKLVNSVTDQNVEEEMNKLKSGIKHFFKPYRGVATKYLSNYLAFFKYKIGKINITESELFMIKGEKPYLSVNFRGRLPVF